MTDVSAILKEHVTLDIECIDRLYLNGYVPTMQTGGQLVKYLHHKGFASPSPTLLGKMTEEHRETVKRFAKQLNIPLIQFEHGQRKEDVVAEYRQRHGAVEGVVVIGTAQEKATAFRASKRTTGTAVGFDYSRQSVAPD